MNQLETDIVVVAAGPAGLAAAISAAERGASVIVFEKAATTGGTGNMGMGPLGVNRLREWEHIQGKGFPIKVTRLKPVAGKVVFNREIVKVEEKSLSESLFEPPKDYTRAEAPAFPKPGAQPGKMPKPK